MLFSYKPDDGDAQQWTFRPRKFPSHEAEAIENATGMTWSEFSEQVLKGSVRARRALLWILLRRQHPVLKFNDVAFSLDEVELELEPDELRAMRGELEKVDDPDVRSLALAQIDEQIAEAEAKDAPKEADSADSANATG